MVFGVLLVMIGFLLIFLSMVRERKIETEAGGIVLIGPIPIVFGTSERIVILTLVLVVIILSILLIFRIFK